MEVDAVKSEKEDKNWELEKLPEQLKPEYVSLC